MTPRLSSLCSSTWEIISLLLSPLTSLYRKIIPPSLKSLDGETILVTGALGGIGKELCKQLVNSSSNIKLVIWDLNLEALKEFALDLKSISKGKGVVVYPQAVDISTEQNIKRASTELKNKMGAVTVLFNNAAIIHPGNFLQVTSSQIQKIFNVNLLSVIWILREFLPDMISANYGRIVNTCSVVGVTPLPHDSYYSSSKYAVNGLTESVKVELNLNNVNGIRVSTVYPYFVNTPMANSFHVDENTNGFLRKLLHLDFQEAEDVAKAMVDGMRREYEHIYVPWYTVLIPVGCWLFPTKLVNYMLVWYYSTIKNEQRQPFQNVNK